jgi:hypothetical protein
MRMRDWQQRLVFVMISTCSALLVAELLARVLWEPGDRQRVIQYDPDLGWALRAGSSLHSVDTDRGLDYQIEVNELGFRDPPRRHLPAQGVKRVLMLGDSMVFGPGVDVAERCSNRLDALLGPGIEVLNAGVGGWGTDQEYLYLCRDGFGLQPDVVVLVLCLVNDVVNNSLSHEFLGTAPKPRFVLRESKLEQQFAPSRPQLTASDHLKHILRRSRLLHYVGRHVRILQAKLRPAQPPSEDVPYYAENIESDMSHWNVFKLPYSESFESAFQVTEALISAARDTCVARGVPMIVFAFPQKAEVDAHARRVELERHGFHEYEFDLNAPYERLRNYCERIQVPFVHPVERFRQHHQTHRLFFERDPHPNAMGHELAAANIAGVVREALVQSGAQHADR